MLLSDVDYDDDVHDDVVEVVTTLVRWVFVFLFWMVVVIVMFMKDYRFFFYRYFHFSLFILIIFHRYSCCFR